MKHLLIENSEGKVVCNNLMAECKLCLANCNTVARLIDACPKYGDKRRFGKIKNNKSLTFLCCSKTKTSKLFRDKLEALSYAYDDLIIPIKEHEVTIREIEQKTVNRLVHNLTSINAFIIQELYNFVPQSVLAANWKTQLDIIEKEIRKEPKEASRLFLRIAKNTIHMKSEFSIYKKLDRQDSTALDFRNYHIRNVLFNILHTFFADFSAKNIYVEVSEFYSRIRFDYETIQVAFYHLIDNALKYAKPNSRISIVFSETKHNVIIEFSMVSLFVNQNERNSVFTEGYSGELAKQMKKNGDGIGMWRIKQMMELNEGEFSARFGDKTEVHQEFIYANNVFTLTFKKT